MTHDIEVADPPAPESGGGSHVESQAVGGNHASSIYACFFLIFLAFPIVESWSRGGWHRPVGLGVALVFAAVYAAGYFSPHIGWRRGAGWRQPSIWAWLLTLVLLTCVMATAAGTYGLALMTYVVAGASVQLPSRAGMVVLVASAVFTMSGMLVVGVQVLIASAITAWVSLIGLMVWVPSAAGRQRELVLEAREEKAELAVALERTRLARDLHDILGHSLTVIAVKAELAGRLVDVDAARAKAEIADVERLSRDALADVRTTVSDYRTLSLPAELARAGRALEAAGIDAAIPSAADDVPTALRDPFAWAVREGVTNVIRHSGARTCTISLSPVSVEVRDDGVATGAVLAGNGLTGLRERARQADMQVEATTLQPRGFLLRMEHSS